MHQVVIIGSSSIIEEHIKVLNEKKFKILSIYSTNPNSENIHRLSRKYNILNVFQKADLLFKFLENKKNFCFLLAPRINDTEKLLLKCLKFKKKIFVEKPLSFNEKFYEKIKDYQNLIFVGYNRIFYNNIGYLKKKLNNAKNLFVSISCSEVKKKDILTNTCHLISIVTEIFKGISVKKIIRKKNFIFAEFADSNKNFFILRISFKAPENFEIKIIHHKSIYILKPIEVMSEFRSMHQVKIDNINFYKPKLFKKINEFKINKYKPGFLEQLGAFKNFVYKNKKHNNTLKKAKHIMSICKKIYSY
jgi:hypothetical protein